MFCPKCGKSVGEGTQFCADCGQSLSPSVRKNKGKMILFIVLGVIALFGLLFFVDTVALDGAIFGTKDKQTESPADKTDTLIAYLKENGAIKDTVLTHVTDQGNETREYSVYDESEGDIAFRCVSTGRYGGHRETIIYVNKASDTATVYCHFNYDEYNNFKVHGNINKMEFRKSASKIDGVEFTGDPVDWDYNEGVFVEDVHLTLQYAQKLLDKAGVDVILADLGFDNYK